MSNTITYPNLTDKEIEARTIDLIRSYKEKKGSYVHTPIPVFEMIEFLGYNVDFKKDGMYTDPNNLGGLRVQDKMVEINENIANQEGRMHFTAAHEIGHIIMHVPLMKKSHNDIFCRKDEGFEGNKKEPIEWQADTFAAFLLMPTKHVKKAFLKQYKDSQNVRKKRLLDLLIPRSPISKAYHIVDKILETGNFENVSRMAMLNRLIGLQLINGIHYQKTNVDA